MSNNSIGSASFTLAFIFAAAVLVQLRVQGDDVLLTLPDLQALLALKQALHDPRAVLSSWNASNRAGACAGLWVGVACAQGMVVSVQLPAKALGGSIATQVGELKNLRKLNLHTNHIQGGIPPSLARLPSLRVLFLFQNQLSGDIPLFLGSDSPLQVVDLSRNQLTGTIPPSLLSSGLFLLDLSFNNLSGALPANASAQLRSLNLSKNRIGSEIPLQLGSLFNLQMLDLSYNNLSGGIPAELGSLAKITQMNLARNNLSGVFPSSFKRLKRLQVLDVACNRLSGYLPSEMAEMESLMSLDLSQNAFIGGIPGDLGQLRNLTAFNVSYNLLTGPIPHFPHVFNATSFLGNPTLCGFDLVHSCSVSSPAPLNSNSNLSSDTVTFHTGAEFRHSHSSMHRLSFILILLSSCLTVTALFGALLLCCCRGKHSEKVSIAGRMDEAEEGIEAAAGGTLALFDGPVTFTADDLLSATAEVMSKSSWGTAYKTTLENGYVVVVKRLREGMIKAQAEFEMEVNSLGRIRHPNLVALRAFYWGPKDEKLLVFDFIPGATLAARLHGRAEEAQPQPVLDWSERMSIAAGIARGLYHLHTQARIDHGNLSSSIVILDSDLNARVADFGLARLMTAAATSNAIATATAVGYRAPELARHRKATFKSDVYSYGIVLLELLTGRSPSELIAMPDGAVDLPQWVTCILKEEWTSEVFDPELVKGNAAPFGEELMQVLQLGLCCVAPMPSARPDMMELMHRLQETTSAFPHQSSFRN